MIRPLLLTWAILLSPLLQSAISSEELDHLFRVAHEVYDPIASEQGALIRFNYQEPNFPFTWWDLDYIRASYVGYENEDGIYRHNIYVFGGMARLEMMDLPTMAMILCHELGHGFAGAPFKEESGASVEGQADYYASGWCATELFKRLENLPENSDPLVIHWCASAFKDYSDQTLCRQKFWAIEKHTEMMALPQYLNSPSSLFASDPTVVEETVLADYFYPPTQCRIDTLRHGALNLPRPSCWFAGK